jgi:hypothetical protein
MESPWNDFVPAVLQVNEHNKAAQLSPLPLWAAVQSSVDPKILR